MAGQAGSAALSADNPSEGGEGGMLTPTPTPSPAEQSWFEQAGVDPRFHETIRAKGWKDPNEVLDSYTNVEKLVSMERGGDVDRIIVKPKPDATPEEIQAFREKAGFTAPADPKEYGFTDEQLAAAPVLNDAAKWFHEAGVPKDVAASIVEKAIARDAEAQQEFVQRTDAEYRTLEQQMGDKFGDFEEAGRRAAKVAGLDGAALDGIERAIGTKAMLTMFAKFGEAMTEASAPTPDRSGGGQFTTTPQQAESRIKTLQKDTDFQAKLLSTNPQVRQAATKEWEELHKAAYPPPA